MVNYIFQRSILDCSDDELFFRSSILVQPCGNGSVVERDNALFYFALSLLRLPPTGSSVSVPVTVSEYIVTFQSLSTPSATPRCIKTDQPNFFDARLRARQDTASSAWSIFPPVFRSVATFAKMGYTQLNMPYMRRAERREYSVQLSTLSICFRTVPVFLTSRTYIRF